MTVHLTKGQNYALAAHRLVLRVEAGTPTDISALLLAADGRVRSEHDFVFYNQAAAPGVGWTSGRTQQIEIDLRALDVPTVMCLISVDPGAQPLGSVPPPRAVVLDEHGAEVAEYQLTDLTTERAVIAWEVYRRGPGWKIRAVGQGYDGGLAQAVTLHGVPVEDEPPAVSHSQSHTQARPAGAPPQSSAPLPPGTSDQERLHRQAVGIFEDAARSTVGLRSAMKFAENRRESELSAALADPSARNSPAATAARTAAEGRYQELATKATADHARDIAQLSAELVALQRILPPSMSDWESASWQQWTPVTEPTVATQAGHLFLPEAPDFRMPMLVGLPLSRPLWIDTAGAYNPMAGTVSPDDLSSLDALESSSRPPIGPQGWQAMTRALVVRVLAGNPVGSIKVQLSDLAAKGGSASVLAPLTVGGSVLSTVVTTPVDLSRMLTELTERVDLIQMARRAGSLDALQGDMDAGERLVILNDFPYGFDDAEIGKVRFLVEEGPSAGVQLLVIASHAEVDGRGPLITSLFRSFLRLPVEPDDHLGDGWTGSTWTFLPDVGPDSPVVLDTVLARLAAAQQT